MEVTENTANSLTCVHARAVLEHNSKYCSSCLDDNPVGAVLPLLSRARCTASCGSTSVLWGTEEEH